MMLSGAPARRSLKRKFDDQQEAGPSHKRVLTYDDQPEDQKLLTTQTVETLQTVCPTIPNMDDPDFVDFIKMLDEPETAMVKPKPKQEPISISDDEPTMADVTLTCREVMLVDCIKPLAFKHMRGDTFLSNQKLIEILPTEDDVIKIQSMLERDLYVNEMD